MGLFQRLIPAGFGLAVRGNEEKIEREALRKIDEGNALEEEGQFVEAMKLYESAIRTAPKLARAHLNRGNILMMRGQLEDALRAYETALTLDPSYSAAHFNIGNAFMSLGRSGMALDSYKEAISLKPDFADAQVALGNTLVAMGRLDEAVTSYHQALRVKPDYAEVFINLGSTLQTLGKCNDALECYRQVLAIKPDYAEAHVYMGTALKDLGRLEDAVVCNRLAIEVRPNLFAAHNNLGNCLKELGNLNDSVVCYRQALEIEPDSAEVHSNLGLALKDLRQYDEAVICLRRALKTQSDVAEVHNSLGHALQMLGQFDAAKDSYQRALEIKPDFAEAHSNLGISLLDLGRLEDAVASFGKALQSDPESFRFHNNLGVAYKELGILDKAIACIGRSLELNPNCIDAHGNRLFIRNYLADQPGSLAFSEALFYGELVERLARPYISWASTPEPERRLRVGLVSGDLCKHPVGYFVVGVLTALVSASSDRLELVAYSNDLRFDALSEKIKTCCRDWHPVKGLSDEQLAEKIYDESVDILIDLSGHTAHNRLPMFAWKPAPVQLSWLGYFATTGVAAMDYFIADPWTLTVSEESHFTEKIYRLPETRLCFTPPDLEVAVSPLPAIENEYITFGCFNHLSKIGEPVVALWARILASVPDSRLFLRAEQIRDQSVRQSIIDRFAVYEVDPVRLILEGPVPRRDYLAGYHGVDIALDPFPYPGGTTTVEALWMGVPVLTLSGERFLSRQGLGLLMNAGLPDWIAADVDDYLARAVSHASDLRNLAALRRELRQQVLASPIFDSSRFAKHFEVALRDMWHTWCRQQQDQS